MIVMDEIVSIFAFANMNMRMRMRRIAMSMRMRMDNQVFAIRPSSEHSSREFAHQARGRAGAEEYQHYSDREFHREYKAGRNRYFENYDRGADRQHGERVAKSPYDADSCRSHQTAFAAQDGRDRDNVIGIGRVPNAEQETDAEDGDEIEHYDSNSRHETTLPPACGREPFPDSRRVVYHGPVAREFCLAHKFKTARVFHGIRAGADATQEQSFGSPNL